MKLRQLFLFFLVFLFSINISIIKAEEKIAFIDLNIIFDNSKAGKEIIQKVIKFVNLKQNEKKNFQSLLAEFKIKEKNYSFFLNPELRIYNQPETITSEADIKTTIYSDNFIVFNILKENGYFNVRYQSKPFMIWIWISVLLISLGGITSLIKKND